MGFRHLKQARVTKKVFIKLGIGFLILTIMGIAICNADGYFDLNSFLKWEGFTLILLVSWICLRFLNRLIYGEDGDTDKDW
jgi:hypothetical protein